MPKAPNNTAKTDADRARVATATASQRERLAAATAMLQRAGTPLSVRALAKAAQVDAALAGVYLRLVRAGAQPVEHPPARGAGRAQATVVAAGDARGPGRADALVDQIRAARDLDALAATANEASACLAGGVIDPNTARALRALLEEQRQALVAARNAPPAAPTGELLATPDAAELVAAYESLVNGRRRRDVLAFAMAQAAEDARDFPGDATPDVVRAKLAELGLDAFGEPSDA